MKIEQGSALEAAEIDPIRALCAVLLWYLEEANHPVRYTDECAACPDGYGYDGRGPRHHADCTWKQAEDEAAQVLEKVMEANGIREEDFPMRVPEVDNGPARVGDQVWVKHRTWTGRVQGQVTKVKLGVLTVKCQGGEPFFEMTVPDLMVEVISRGAAVPASGA